MMTTQLPPNAAFFLLRKVGGTRGRELGDLRFHDEETVSSGAKCPGKREGDQKGEEPPPSPASSGPQYATWVGACHTHPRAHSHLRRAPARAGRISVPVGAGSPPATPPPPAAASPGSGGGTSPSLPTPALSQRGSRILQGRAEATSSPGPSPVLRRRRREELWPQPAPHPPPPPKLPLPSPRLPQPSSSRASAWAPRSESLGNGAGSADPEPGKPALGVSSAPQGGRGGRADPPRFRLADWGGTQPPRRVR